MARGGEQAGDLDRLPFRRDAIDRYRRLAPLAEVARDPAAVMSYTSFRGYYWSLLMGKRFPYESLLECYSMLLHDVDPTVAFFRAQPVTIRVKFEGQWFQYTPDLHVGFVSGDEYLLEVKTIQQRKKLDDRRLRGMAYACSTHGLRHAFLYDAIDLEVEPSAATPPGVYDDPLYTNSVRTRAAPAFLTNTAILDVAKAIESVGLPCRLQTLCLAMTGDLRIEPVLGLVALRILTVPLELEITPFSVVEQGSAW